MDWITSKKPKFLGLLTGAVAGLATITPAAGYVSPATACLIGVIAGVVCFYAVALKNKLGWDDALDVWGVHGVGGFLGIVLLGVFATTAFNPAGVDGLLARQPALLPRPVRRGRCSPRSGRSSSRSACSGSIDRVTPVKVEDATEELGPRRGHSTASRPTSRVAKPEDDFRSMGVPAGRLAEAATGKHLAILSLTALGIVYGDIGTSPLYALKVCFSGLHAIPSGAARTCSASFRSCSGRSSSS